VAQNLLSVKQLLDSDTSNSKHGKAAVLELLSLDDALFRRVRRVPSKRIPLEISRLLVSFESRKAPQVLGFRARLPLCNDFPAFNECTKKDKLPTFIKFSLR
jgi:hypothetical protein